MNLKPCPFCGQTAETVVGEHNFNDAKVRCNGCHTEGALYDEEGVSKAQNVSAAESAWNLRASPAEGFAQWVSFRKGVPALHQHCLLWVNSDDSTVPVMGTANQDINGDIYFAMANSNKRKDVRNFSHWMPVPTGPGMNSPQGGK